MTSLQIESHTKHALEGRGPHHIVVRMWRRNGSVAIQPILPIFSNILRQRFTCEDDDVFSTCIPRGGTGYYRDVC